MLYLTFNQKSNQYLDASPIFQQNNESSPWGFENSNLDFSHSGANLFNRENFFKFEENEMEILENLHEYDELNYMEKVKKEEGFPNFNSVLSFNQQSLTIPQPEQKDDTEKKLQIQKEEEIAQKSTGDNTNNSKININKLIFGLKSKKTIEPRIDYAIKSIKGYISKYLKNYGNKLIKECNFQNKLQKMKLFAPSYYYFTGNSNEKDNSVFLNFTIEQILTYPDEKNKKKKDNRLQRQNQKKY